MKAKKLLSLILCALLLFTLSLPATAAAESETVTIYVEGYSDPLYADNENPSEDNMIYPTGVDIGESVMNALQPCLEKLAQGIVIGDYSEYIDELYNSIGPIYSKLRLSPDGTVTDGSGRGVDMLKDDYDLYKYPGIAGKSIGFNYDWRLSCEYIAQILAKFIDRVREEQKVDKVNLIGRCLGGNVVAAYIAQEKDIEQKVDKIIIYDSPVLGIDPLGHAFSGDMIFNADTLSNFCQDFLASGSLFEDPVLSEFLASFVELINQAKLLGLGTDLIQKFLDGILMPLIPRVVRASYGSFISFWNMVPAHDIENAIEFTYSTDELKEEYKGSIEKIRSFRDNVQIPAEKNMKALKEKGVEFMIVAKYNIPCIPIYDNAAAQSDIYVETSVLSFGCTAANYGEVLSDEYINALTSKGLDKYLSADKIIDASTCLFPDTTWFIKNANHSDFPDSFDAIISKFITTDNMTVFTYEEYPQYMTYDRDTETFINSVTPDEPIPETGSLQGIFNALVRFFKSFVQWISSLFGN